MKLARFLLIFIIFSSMFPFANASPSGVRNVIILIGDGMGFSQLQLTKLVYGHLNMEDFPYTGIELTDSLSGEVTDSAAAGTAIATGVKTYNRMISTTNVTGKLVNLTTLLEIAQMLGKATGLVTTTRITHATPAVFASHVPDRDMEEEIARQLILHNVTVLMGGGREKFSEEVLKLAEDYGYSIVYTREDLEKVKDGKVLGLFAEGHLPYVLDRSEEDVSLLEMTKKAIEILEKNPNGFFLMIEGGRIDHACHANDVASIVAETKEFDDVVGYVLDYARRRGDTLVIVLADHETGGLGIGLNYGHSVDIDSIRRIDASIEEMSKEIKSGGDIRDVIRRHTGLELTDEEVKEIEEAKNSTNKYALGNIIGEIISKKLGVGFVSHKHTGEPVPLLAYGPGAENFVGFKHHVDTAKVIAKLMIFGDRSISFTIKGVSKIKGDVTGDYRVDERDAYATLMLLLGDLVDTELENIADMDNNGIIDLLDVMAILQASS
nr:TPA: alkaline phosphatase IV precursor [Pyrococcus abyssi GE5]